jgi:serine/threonine-protein kinase RsbW
MDVVFSLALPREEASVPVVRQLCRASLQNIGAMPECVSDIELALTEACTNVLQHAFDSREEYRVDIRLDDEKCSIAVIDEGRGFDHPNLAKGEEAAMGAEGGRGIQLMRALVDKVNFNSEPEQGTMVRLVKGLELKEDSVLLQLGHPDPPAGEKNASMAPQD